MMSGGISWQSRTEWPHAVAQIDIEPLRTALIMVDIQNYSPGNWEIAPNCHRLQSFFKAHDLPIVYLRVGSLLSDRRDMHAKRALAWLRPSASEPAKSVVKGTSAHDILDAVAPSSGELVIDKNSSSAFNSSALEHYLRAWETQNLVLCGSSTSHCVVNTGRGGADRGYNVILVEDACKDGDARHHETSLRAFGKAFGAVKSTDAVLDDFARLLGTSATPSHERTLGQ